MTKFSSHYISESFTERMKGVDALLSAAEKYHDGDLASRQLRGYAFVGMHGAYENLLRDIAREILETAQGLRGKRNNLNICLQRTALQPAIQALRECGEKKIPEKLSALLANMRDSNATVLTNIFPDSGTYFDEKQLSFFCSAFDLEDCKKTLGRTEGHIGTIRRNRNKISHGERTSEEVGREYTLAGVQSIAESWCSGWGNFIQAVDQKCQEEKYFRK